jgi:hypothetical protein
MQRLTLVLRLNTVMYAILLLTLQIPAVILHIARFNIENFYFLSTECAYVLYGTLNKEELFLYCSHSALSITSSQH